MNNKIKVFAAVLSAVSGFFLAAASPAAAKVIKVDVAKMVFSPEKISAHVGDVIEWTNSDFVAHTATEKNGEWEVLLPVKATASTTLKKEGKIDYYCKYHPNMKGQIEVNK